MPDGGAIKICDADSIMGVTWGIDNNIYFSEIVSISDSTYYWKIRQVAATTKSGRKETILVEQSESFKFLWPEALPNGKLLHTKMPRNSNVPEDGEIIMIDLETGKEDILRRGYVNARYSTSGHLLFANSRGLFEAPFNPKKSEIDAERLIEQNFVLEEEFYALLCHF